MEKTFYFYLGRPKTASTFISQFLGKNENLLKDHYHLTWFRLDNNYPITLHDQVKGILADKKLNIKNLFISPPLSLQYNNFEKVWSILKDKNIKVKFIIYFRRPADLFASYFSENMKEFLRTELLKNNLSTQPGIVYQNIPEYFKLSYSIKKIDEFILFEKQVITFVIDCLQSIPRESFILQPFEKVQFYHNNIWEDFLYKLNIKDTKEKFYIPEMENMSLLRNQADILKLLQSSCYDFGNEQLEYILDYFKALGDARPIIETLEDSFIKEIVDSLNPYYEKLAKVFLNRDYFFENPYPNIYGKERPPYQPLSPLEVAQIQEFIAGKRAYFDYTMSFQIQENINRVEQVLGRKMDQMMLQNSLKTTQDLNKISKKEKLKMIGRIFKSMF